MRNPLVEANKAFFGQVNKVREWHKLPRPLALLNLRAFRDELRELNLYDTEPSPEAHTRRAASTKSSTPFSGINRPTQSSTVWPGSNSTK